MYLHQQAVRLSHIKFLIRYFNGLVFCRFLTTFRGHVNRVYQVAWSADSRLLCSGSSDSTLKVWDIKQKKLLIDLPGHADEVLTELSLLIQLQRVPELSFLIGLEKKDIQ